jgi:O-antigen/teichoic acid export membrane protein
MTEQRTRFAFDVGWAFVSQVTTLIVGFVLGIVLARWLGPHQLGLYRISFVVYAIATLVSTFGIPSSLTKLVAELKTDSQRTNRIVSCAFANSFVFGIIVFAVIFGISSPIAQLLDMPELGRLLRIVAFALPFVSLHHTEVGLLNGLRRMKWFAVLNASYSVLMFSAVISLVLGGFGVEGAIFGLLLAVAMAAVLGFVIAKKYFSFDLQDYVRNSREILSFSSKVFSINAINQINYYVDTVLIGYFLVSTQVGYYSIAVGLSRFLWIIPGSIQTITFPATSEYWSRNDRQAMFLMFDKSMKYSACVLLPVGMCLAFFAEDVITLVYGAEYTLATSPLIILLVATIAGGATSRSIGATLAAIGRPGLGACIAAAATVPNIVLNIILIPRFGIVGAAIATAVTLLLIPLANLFFIIKYTGFRMDFLWYIKAVFMVLAGISAFLFLRQFNYYLTGVLVVVIFILGIWFFLLNRDDKTYFGTFLTTIRSYLT